VERIHVTCTILTNRDLCLTPLDLKTMGFFSVPRLPGWFFQQRIHGEFCSIRIAPINRDLRDMVDIVDVFPFLNKAQRAPRKDCMSCGLNAGHT